MKRCAYLLSRLKIGPDLAINSSVVARDGATLVAFLALDETHLSSLLIDIERLIQSSQFADVDFKRRLKGAAIDHGTE